MIGKTIFFKHLGKKLQGEVIDKIMMYCGRSFPETGYLVIATDGSACKVEINDIIKVIL